MAVDPPLRPNHWFDDISTSLAFSKPHLIIFLLPPQANLLEIFFYNFSALESFHTFVLSTIFINETVVSQYVDEFKFMSLTTLIIVWIMCRSYFDAACSEILFYHGVSNNFHLSFRNEWMDQFLSYQMLISLVFRVDGDSSVTKHSFDTGGGDYDFLCWIVLELISEMDEHTELNFFSVSWNVQECSLLDVFELHLNV